MTKLDTWPQFLNHDTADQAHAVQEVDPHQYQREQEHRHPELVETRRETPKGTEGVLDLEQVLVQILEQMARLLPFDTASIQLLSPGSNELAIIASKGFDDPADVGTLVFPLEDTYPNVRVWRRKMPLRYPDVREHFPHFADPKYHATQVHGWLGAPLVVGDRAIGVITLDSFTPDSYTPQHEQLAMVFASQAAIAIQNARLFDSAQRRIRDLEIVNDIAQIIGTKLDTQDLLKAIVSQIADKLNCTHCTLFFPQKEKDELLLVPQVTHGARGEQIMTRRFKPGGGLAGWVFQHGESLVLPDAKQDPRFSSAREYRERPRSMLVAPVKVGDRTIGVISADQDEFNWFSESDRRLVDALARQAGIAIERAAALELLHDIGKRIISEQKVDEILQQIVRGAIELTNTTSGVIYLVSEDGKSVISSYQHPPEFHHPKPRLAREEGITRQVIASGTEIIFPDIHQDPRVNPVLHDRVRSMIAVPLKLDERKVIGVLYLNDASPHSFTETEVSLLSTLATEAAIAIMNARLLQNTSKALKKRVAEMETLQEINEAITSTLELNTILEMILDRALGLTQASCGTVQLISEDGQGLVLKSARGAILASIGERLKLGEGVTGMAAQDGRAYRISDVQLPRWAHIHRASIPGKRSELAVPMRFEGQVVGVISLESANADAFSEDDERLLVGLARQAAIAIRNAMRYKELENTRDRMLASEAVAWLGLFGADWQHTINQKTFSIGNYVDGLRRWLNGCESPSDMASEVFQVLGRIEKVAESIRDVQFTSQVPAEMPGGGGGRTIIDDELPEIVNRWCSGRRDVHKSLGLNCSGIEVQIAPQWLKVAMEKLVNNALKAMPTGGQLSVATRLVSDMVHITIKDTGQGIPDSIRSYFLKRVVPRRDEESGTGMGALIARFVALSHGGDLILVDSRPGEGTELLMTLPVAVNGEPFDDGGK